MSARYVNKAAHVLINLECCEKFHMRANEQLKTHGIDVRTNDVKSMPQRCSSASKK